MVMGCLYYLSNKYNEEMPLVKFEDDDEDTPPWKYKNEKNMRSTNDKQWKQHKHVLCVLFWRLAAAGVLFVCVVLRALIFFVSHPYFDKSHKM